MIDTANRADFESFVAYVLARTVELHENCNNVIKQFGNQPDNTAIPRAGDERAAGNEGGSLAKVAYALFRARRASLTDTNARELFQDPAWDMLLDLYVAKDRHAQISVTSATLASHAPQTTALRYLWHLESLSLVERKSDAKDRRRTFVQLTQAGLKLVESVLNAYELQFRPLYRRTGLR